MYGCIFVHLCVFMHVYGFICMCVAVELIIHTDSIESFNSVKMLAARL